MEDNNNDDCVPKLVTNFFFAYSTNSGPTDTVDYFSFRTNNGYLLHLLNNEDAEQSVQITENFFKAFFTLVLHCLHLEMNIREEAEINFAIFFANTTNVLCKSENRIKFGLLLRNTELFWNLIKRQYQYNDSFDFDIQILNA